MKYSKLTAVILTAALLLGLFGCTQSTPAATDAANTPVAATATPAPTQEPTEAPEEPADTPEEPTDAPEEPAAPAIVFTDMSGREITLDAPAERVVALTAADCEILFAIGAGDTLVGRGEYCDYPMEVLDAPSVQSGYETNIEQIIALEPQVVLMATMAQTVEQVEQLENAGVTVVVSDAQDIAGVYTAIEMIGKVTGKEQNAAAVIDEMQQKFARLSDATENTGKTVYFEVSPLEWGLWAAGAGTFMDEIANIVGLTNAFADVPGWGEVSEEQVIERDPDYIVTITMYFGEGPTPVEEIMGRTGWENLTAVQTGAVYNADSNELSRPGPRLADAAEGLYEFIQSVEVLEPAA